MSDEFINFCRQMSGLRVFVFYCLEATYTNLRSLDILANWFSTFTYSETTSIPHIKKEVPLHPLTTTNYFTTTLLLMSSFSFGSGSAVLLPNTICASSFQDFGMSNISLTASSITGL